MNQAGVPAVDLGRIDAVLQAAGPLAAEALLREIGGPVAAAVARVIARAAPLLGPLEPAHARTDVLLCQLAATPELRPLVEAYAASLPALPRLGYRRLPAVSPALRRVLAGPADRAGESVDHSVLAPDCSWLASGYRDGTVQIRAVDSGETWTVRPGPGSQLWGLAVSPDGSWLAVGYADAVRLWDPVTGAAGAVLPGGVAGPIVFAPDGSWLASTGWDGTVRIWHTRGEAGPVLTGHTRQVEQIAVAADGSWLATGGRDRTVRVWDSHSGRLLAVRSGGDDDGTVGPGSQQGAVSALGIAPDGSWLAAGGTGGAAWIGDPATSETRAVLAGHTGTISQIAVAPDGSWLATCSYDSTVRVWDPVTGASRAVLAGHTGPVHRAVAAPDGSWLATAGGDDTIRLWDAHRWVADGVLRYPAEEVQLASSPDGSTLLLTQPSGSVLIWDVAVARGLTDDRREEVVHLTGCQGATWLVSKADRDAAGPPRPAGTGQRPEWDVRVRDAATGEVLVTLPWPGWVDAVAPDQTWLAVVSSDGDGDTVRIWDPATDRDRAVLTGPGLSRFRTAAAPDGAGLAVWGEDRTVRLWDPATGDTTATMTARHGIYDVAIAPAGDWLAIAAGELVMIKNARTGRTRRVLRAHSGPVNAVAIAPDGSWLATGGWDQTVRIWAARTGRPGHVLTGHSGFVFAVAISPDGGWLASLDMDHVLRVWHAPTGTCSAAMRVGRSSRARQCRWLPDGSGICVVGGGEAAVFSFTPGLPPGGATGTGSTDAPMPDPAG
jgi:WD40 repeat protein